MTVAAEIPANLAGIYIPIAPAARHPVQDRMGGGSYATRMESYQPASNPGEAQNSQPAADPALLTPRDPRAADVLVMQVRLGIARLRDEGPSKGRQRSRANDSGGESDANFTPRLGQRLSALLGDNSGNRMNLHFEV